MDHIREFIEKYMNTWAATIDQSDKIKIVSDLKEWLQVIVLDTKDESMKGQILFLGAEALAFCNFFRDALTHYRTALESATRLEEKERVGDVLTHMGDVYDALGEYEDAIHCFKRAFHVYQLVPNMFKAFNVLSDLESTYESLLDKQDGLAEQGIQYCWDEQLKIRQASVRNDDRKRKRC